MRARIATILIVLSSALSAHADSKQVSRAGFVFVAPANGSPKLREAPATDAKILASPANGSRLIYRTVMEDGGKTEWFKCEIPGGAAGWIAAGDTTDKRPEPLPETKKMEFKQRDIIVGGESHTAAARGIDGRVKTLKGKGKQEKRDAALANLEGLESTVLQEFSKDGVFVDHLTAEGNYEDVPNPVRERDAKDFHAAPEAR